MNRTKVTIDLEFKGINGKHMDLSVNGEPVSLSDKAQVETICDLPSEYILEFSGKDPRDTKIDSDGNIIDDIFIRIKSIKIDGIRLPDTYVHQKIKIKTDSGEEIQTSHIGYNGIVVIPLAESTSFTQYQSMLR